MHPKTADDEPLPPDDAAAPTEASTPGADADEAGADADGAAGPSAVADPSQGPVAAPSVWRGAALPIAAALIALLAGSALFVSGYALGRQTASDPGTPASEADAFQPFWDTYHAIRDRYAGEPVDRSAIVAGAIRGMIDALGDPYSAYLSAEQYRESILGVNGRFEGIGAEIATQAPDGSRGCSPLGDSCRLVVTRPLPGSPAETAGLRGGDVILATDGTPLDGLTVDAARDRIRGPKGTVVTLTVERNGATPFDLAVTRDVVQRAEVESEVLADGAVGYIRLLDFSDAAADQVTAAISGHLAAGRTDVILDLRGNPGGFVTAARKVASQFIGSGVLFWEQDAAGGQTPTMVLGDGVATDPAIRVVALIDGGTASASEIVAGALQDSGRATLVGSQSFGKGTVQQWQELTAEGGAFKLTVARWLTPDKRWIHGTGLTPDVEVAPSDAAGGGDDPVIDRALDVLGVRATSAIEPLAA